MKTYILIVLAVFSTVLSSCVIRSADQVVDRNEIPAVISGVPATESEVRDISFNRVAGESGHKDLHIRGMIYTKSDNGSGVQLAPCKGCVVTLKGIKDTSEVIRMTSADDGYFSFHGHSGDFVLTLNNPGHNSVVVDHIDFQAGGVNKIILVNASGNLNERFVVSRNGGTYTWTRQ